jgi:hypothetical protein
MSSENKTILGILTVFSVSVPVILGLSLGWPAWLWLCLTAVTLAIPVLVGRQFRAHARQERTPPIIVPPPPPERPRLHPHTVTAVALPSSVADYDFLFSGTILWHVSDGQGQTMHVNPAALAVEAILERAKEVTSRESPDRWSLIQHRLNSTLGIVLPDPSGQVMTMARDVTVTLSEGDLQRLRTLSEVRKNEQVWEHERSYERSKRAYLGNDVLKDPGSAVVWWLARNDTQVNEAVGLIGTLAQLSAAANNTEVQEPFRHLVGDQTMTSHDPAGPEVLPTDLLLPRQFVPWTPGYDGSLTDHVGSIMDKVGLAPDDPQRALFAHRFAKLLETLDRPQDAHDVRQRFDAPPAPPAGDEPAPNDEGFEEVPPPGSAGSSWQG